MMVYASSAKTLAAHQGNVICSFETGIRASAPELINQILCAPLGPWSLFGLDLLDSTTGFRVTLSNAYTAVGG